MNAIKQIENEVVAKAAKEAEIRLQTKAPRLLANTLKDYLTNPCQRTYDQLMKIIDDTVDFVNEHFENRCVKEEEKKAPQVGTLKTKTWDEKYCDARAEIIRCKIPYSKIERSSNPLTRGGTSKHMYVRLLNNNANPVVAEIILKHFGEKPSYFIDKGGMFTYKINAVEV